MADLGKIRSKLLSEDRWGCSPFWSLEILLWGHSIFDQQEINRQRDIYISWNIIWPLNRMKHNVPYYNMNIKQAC